MKWNISAWPVRHPLAPILFSLLLCAAGMASFGSLPIMRYPNIDNPVITVSISDGDVSPSEMETQVTKKVEDAVSGVTDVRHVLSTVTQGHSSTTIEFRIGANIETALNAVQNQVAGIRSALPTEIDEPLVRRNASAGHPMRSYGVYAPNMTDAQLSWFVDDTVIRELQGLLGVGEVDRVGGTTREIQARLSPDKLMALRVTAASVNQQLALTNIDLPGGISKVGGQEQIVRTLASAHSVEDLSAMSISLADGRRARLGDLAAIVDTGADPTSFASFNGTPVVAFSIHSAIGASDVDVAARVDRKLDEIANTHPEIRFSRVDDRVGYTLGNYQAAMDTLYEGAALAVIVVFLFLRDWRATLIAATALPLSAIPTFWVMDTMGFSLNIVSLLAITLATGILVDDTIVEIENIARHVHAGKSPFRAAVEAADEIGLTVVAISMTIIAIFLPVSFMSGIAGQYFKQFGLTIGVSVFFSLLVARFITPMMAAYLMRPHANSSSRRSVGLGILWEACRMLPYFIPLSLLVLVLAFSLGAVAPPSIEGPALLISLSNLLCRAGWVAGSIIMMAAAMLAAILSVWPRRAAAGAPGPGLAMRLYLRILQATLKRGVRWIVLSVGILSFVGSMSLMGRLPSDFVPNADESRIEIAVELPPGSSLDDTHTATRGIASMIKAVAGVQGVFVIGGTSPVGAPEVRRATLIVTLLPRSGRTESQRDIQELISARLSDTPDIRYSFDTQETVAVVGDNGNDVSEAALSLEQAMSQDRMFVRPMAFTSFASPELRIVPKLDLVSSVGITPSDISSTVRIATSGASVSQLSNMVVDGRQVPVRVELDPTWRSKPDVLGAMQIPRRDGTSVPLASIARIEKGTGPASIDRYDRKRLVNVGFDAPSGTTAGDASDHVPDMAVVKSFPPGVGLKPTGNAEEKTQMFSQFGIAMTVGIVAVLVILMLLFGDVFSPIAILTAMPLSLCGVALALTLSQSAFSLSVTIGLLMLMGIVTKNTIMLVQFAKERVAHGERRNEAIVEACRMRARPIVMTTIAMIAGMMPAAIGVGAGAELREPMAIAVVGGLVTSTLLSLLFIPAVFTLTDDISKVSVAMLRWLLRPNSVEETKTQQPSKAEMPGIGEFVAARRSAAE